MNQWRLTYMVNAIVNGQRNEFNIHIKILNFEYLADQMPQ